MQNQLAKVDQGNTSLALSAEQIDTLSSSGIIPKGTPAANVEVFRQFCESQNLNPFIGQVHLLHFKDKNRGDVYMPYVGIEGLRAKAARTGLHVGTKDPVFNRRQVSPGKFIEFTIADLESSNEHSVTCTVTVEKWMFGQVREFTHTIKIDEFYGASSRSMLKNSMRIHLASKCAESFALKKAFPEELAGIHLQEEAYALQQKTVAAETANTTNLEPVIVLDAEDIETIDEGRKTLLEEWRVKIANCKTPKEFSEMSEKNVKGNDAVLGDKDIMAMLLQAKSRFFPENNKKENKKDDQTSN